MLFDAPKKARDNRRALPARRNQVQTKRPQVASGDEVT
jgi:hypothetical protein